MVGSPVVQLDGSAFALPAARGADAAGAFTLTDATSNGGAASIGYSYDPAAANLDFLRGGHSLTITYQVQVNDGTANSATQDVTFTITGTNDAPVLSDTTNPAAVVGGWATLRRRTWRRSPAASRSPTWTSATR